MNNKSLGWLVPYISVHLHACHVSEETHRIYRATRFGAEEKQFRQLHSFTCTRKLALKRWAERKSYHPCLSDFVYEKTSQEQKDYLSYSSYLHHFGIQYICCKSFLVIKTVVVFYKQNNSIS